MVERVPWRVVVGGNGTVDWDEGLVSRFDFDCWTPGIIEDPQR